MFNKDIQYVNILKTQQNIKINYEILEKDKIIKNEQSIFLLDNGTLCLDTQYKLQTLEQTIPKTYISAICEDTNQKIIEQNNPLKQNTATITFDHNHIISIDNANVNRTNEFYGNYLDYLISPFTILHQQLTQKLQANSLNILILNNKLYAIILDENQRYNYSCIEELISFEDIKQSNFYTDEIVEQKLYDEIYTLELNEKISNITQQYYEENDDNSFLENINIYYNIKQLNDEQIKNLEENLMIELSYNEIDINQILYKIVKKSSVKKYSFISARVKKSHLSLLSWSIIAILSTLITSALVYYFVLNDDKEIKKPKPIHKTLPKKIVKIEEILLPNHQIINKYIKSNIMDIFNTIDDNSVLQEIQIQKNESTLVYNFIEKDSYKTTLKDRLLKIYKNSENILTSKNNNVYSAIISDTNPIKQYPVKAVKKYKKAKNGKIMDAITLVNLLKSKSVDSKIIHLSTTGNKYIIDTFQVIMKVKTPKDFFNFIDKIDKQNISIVIDYPIEFAKVKDTIEIKFKVKINQNK